MKRRIWQLGGFLALAVTLWMSYDNVFSDDTPIRALAEKTACDKHSLSMKSAVGAKPADACAAQHGMTREQRAPWGQTLEYQWIDATLSVSCHRDYYVFGERRCAVE